jgi:hypothetical protein
MERERELGLEAIVAELRADVRHLATDVVESRQEFRHDIRRLDARLFQLLLTQIATLATALGALVAVLAG